MAALQRLGAGQLRQRYAELFGETTNANNKAWLLKRIAWRLQALAEGDLSERARQRAAELACDADLRLNPPRGMAREAVADEAQHQTRTPAASRWCGAEGCSGGNRGRQFPPNTQRSRSRSRASRSGTLLPAG
jgi:hypothetical protein